MTSGTPSRGSVISFGSPWNLGSLSEGTDLSVLTVPVTRQLSLLAALFAISQSDTVRPYDIVPAPLTEPAHGESADAVSDQFSPLRHLHSRIDGVRGVQVPGWRRP